MLSLRKILVDVDALAPDHPALTRAVDLANRCGAEITVADVLPIVPNAARRLVTERVEQELLEHRQERLQAAARRAGAPASTATRVLRGQADEAMIEEVAQGDYDLLIRSHGRDLADPLPSLGSIDTRLVRYCRCPVWILAPGRAEAPRRILAAIDAMPHADAVPGLVKKILDTAVFLGTLEHAEVTVLYAWQFYGESLLRPRMSADVIAELSGEMEATAKRDLAKALRDAEYAEGHLRTVLVKGEPEQAIPDYLRDHAIDLVVLGTVSRQGLAGMVTGNTAERVLHELRGSVLAVKR